MKALKTTLLLIIFISGASAFSQASNTKNKVIQKQISMTSYSKLMGIK